MSTSEYSFFRASIVEIIIFHKLVRFFGINRYTCIYMYISDYNIYACICIFIWIYIKTEYFCGYVNTIGLHILFNPLNRWRKNACTLWWRKKIWTAKTHSIWMLKRYLALFILEHDLKKVLLHSLSTFTAWQNGTKSGSAYLAWLFRK